MGEATGVANTLFAVHWGERDLVLRRGPAAKVTASAGNTMREARLLAALSDTDVRHPRLVAACDDTAVIGAPFILMERIDGFTPIDPLPGPVRSRPVPLATGSAPRWSTRWPSWRWSTGKPSGSTGSASPTDSWPARSTGGCGSSTATAPGTFPSSTP